MNKKSIKLFAVSALAFFASATLVNAKTYTNLDDLTKDVVAWKTKESDISENDINFIYIIGEHVFTPVYLSTMTDSFDYGKAIQTIPISMDPYIFEIDTIISDDKLVWDTKNQTNLYKTSRTEFPETLNIKYIDMERFGDKVTTNEEVESLVDVANSHVNDKLNTSIYDKYELSFDEATGKVTFTAKDPSLTIEEIKNSGIIAELNRILATGNYTEIKITDLAEDGKSASLTANATTESIAESITKLVNGATDLADLTSKKFKIEFVLVEGKIPADGNKDTFTLEFRSIAATNEYFKNNDGSSYSILCKTNSDEKKCTAVLNILNPNKNVSGMDGLATVISNALKSKLVDNVNLQLGNKNKNIVFNNGIEDSKLKTDISKYLSAAVNTNGTYGNLDDENFGKIIITFNLKDGVDSKYTQSVTSETYEFEVGEYVDTDNIVDKIATENNTSNVGDTYSEASDYNKYYHLSRNDNQLTFDVNLKDSGKLYNFKPVVTGFEKIIYGETQYSVIKKDGNIISKIVIIDNKTHTEYELKTSGDNGDSLETILTSMLGTSGISSNIVSPTMLSNLNFSIKFEIATDKELIPGLNGYGIYTEDSQSATYDVSFKINGFNVEDMIKKGFKNESYLTATDEDTSEDDNVYSLKVDLTNVGTSLEEADLFNKLGWYAGLFKNLTMTVGETETSLDVNNLDILKETIDTLLGLDETSTIEDLYNKEFTLKFELADDVNLSTFNGTEVKETTDRKAGPYTINVKLTYDVEKVAKNGSIDTALSKQPEVIELTAGELYGAGLTITNNANLVINGNGATINGNVTIQSDNVTLNDVNIIGKLTIDDSDSEEGITIKGNGNTTITGAIKVQHDENVTIDGIKITGTNDGIELTNNKNAVISSIGKGTFTLKNSEVSYSGGKVVPENGEGLSSYVYSLVYIDGNAEISDNTFDITNVKNPIEYKYGTSEATNIVINHNTFTGNNYVKSDAHNVISFYGAAKGSVIKVTNNTFGYANWAVRISNTTSSNEVTYIITGNHVEKNQLGDEKSERNPLALVGVQEINDDDLANITIVYDNNTASGYVTYETKSEAFNKALDEGKSALVYAYKKNGEVSDNLPKLQTYEDYVKELNSTEE